ncbi:MAG: type II CAAX prenyl endopeptidase Rce1 family protein [Bacillota bacterium]
MNTPILYHNLLVLLATVYPVSLPQIAANFIPPQAARHSNIIYLAGSVLVCGSLLAVSSFLVPLGVNLALDATWLLLALAIAPLLLGLEFLVGAVILKLSGVGIGGWGVNPNWVKVSWVGFLLALALAILEELLFRQLWGVILITNLGLPAWGYIAISAVAYGFNHLYYGLSTFLQKVSTGLFLALVYWLSGGLILIPIAAHVLQNAIILIWGRSRQ